MDRSKCIALIRLYKTKDVLWNVKNPYYRNKAVRDVAWKEISEKMKLPVNLLKSKMTILLSSYRTYKSKLKKARKSASGGIASTWFAYNEFTFLTAYLPTKDAVNTLPDRPRVRRSGGGQRMRRRRPGAAPPARRPLAGVLRQTPCIYMSDLTERGNRTSHNTDTSGFDSQDPLADVPVQETKLPMPPEVSDPLRTIKPCTEPTPAAALPTEQNHTLFREVFEILKSSAYQSTDSYVTFGQHIANELRKYDPTTLAHVKHAINNVIFEADIGMYSSGNRRVENTAGNTALGPAIGCVGSMASSMFFAKQDNEENQALEVAAIQEAPDYFS